MDIATLISTNLTRWMSDNHDLNTDKKVEAKSGIGSSTVQRARTGNANVTVKSLEAIALAFGRTANELLLPPDPLSVKQQTASYVFEKEHPAITEVARLMRKMDDVGKGRVLERAEALSEQHAITRRGNAA